MISQRQLFLQHVAQTSTAPMGLEVERASGIYITGRDKKRYIDLISGISVSSLGHKNTAVNRAIGKQLKKYMHTMVYGEMVQGPQVRLARLLTEQLPGSLNSVYFVNSGSEAVEGAMKLAKRATGRQQIVSCKNAYHGSTQGALSIMGSEYFKNAFRPLLPAVKQISFNRMDEIGTIDAGTAAIFVEIIQGEAGAIPGDTEWLQAVRKRCDETGALMIVDEIQSGYGRTGDLFAFRHAGIVPDILLLAKAFGGGMPLGAFVASVNLMQKLTENPVLGHITTFGGHPVCCAAGLETLRILLSTDHISEVAGKEMLFRSLLDHPAIVQISGKGLLLAVTFESEPINKKVIARCMANGLITDWFLFNDHSLRIAPPLIITKDQIKKACGIILKCIDEALAMS